MTRPEDLTSMGVVTPTTQVTAPTASAASTVPTAPAGTAAPGLDEAVLVADAAARSAGVTVREVGDLDELGDVVDLFATIWGRGANPPVTLELLRAFTKAGTTSAARSTATGSSAPVSASSTPRPRTPCTATSPASPRSRSAAAWGSPSSCTSARG